MNFASAAPLRTVVLDTATQKPLLLEHGPAVRGKAEAFRRAGFASEAHLLSGIACGLAGEAYDAVGHFRAWLDEDRVASRLALVKDEESSDYAVWLVTPAPPGLDTAGKGRFIADLVRNPVPVDLSAAAAVAWGIMLLTAGRAAEAVAYLTRVRRARPHYVVDSAEAAASLAASGEPVPAFLDFYVGKEPRYFLDKFCAKPFTDFEISPDGSVHICCPAYLPTPVGNVRTERADEILNADRAQRIRRSILDGSFKYCNPSRCKLIKEQRLTRRDAIADPDMREIVAAGRTVVAAARDVRLSYDPTCNLSCPSCRVEPIVAKGAALDFVMRTTDDVVLPLLRRARTVLMNGYGDVFASRSCRRILGAIDRGDFPDLTVDIITNGVLFTEREWNKLPKLHDRVRHVRVSIDAATEATYRSVRRGGDFAKLKRNLAFLARLRRSGVIRRLSLSYVYQQENLDEMIPFAEWARALGCDGVIFEPIMDWQTYPDDEYRARAVHHPDHPLHARFRTIASDPRLRAPFVELTK